LCSWGDGSATALRCRPVWPPRVLRASVLARDMAIPQKIKPGSSKTMNPVSTSSVQVCSKVVSSIAGRD
jgi:hypothetical protein